MHPKSSLKQNNYTKQNERALPLNSSQQRSWHAPASCAKEGRRPHGPLGAGMLGVADLSVFHVLVVRRLTQVKLFTIGADPVQKERKGRWVGGWVGE